MADHKQYIWESNIQDRLSRIKPILSYQVIKRVESHSPFLQDFRQYRKCTYVIVACAFYLPWTKVFYTRVARKPQVSRLTLILRQEISGQQDLMAMGRCVSDCYTF